MCWLSLIEDLIYEMTLVYVVVNSQYQHSHEANHNLLRRRLSFSATGTGQNSHRAGDWINEEQVHTTSRDITS